MALTPLGALTSTSAQAVVPTHVVVANPASSTRPVLYFGMSHPAVSILQRRLGSPYATGYFGPITLSYVQRLQRATGIPVTGIVDRRTWRKSRNVQLPLPQPPAPATGSPVLGSHPSLGSVSAPLIRFRDGGHAYYLYGKGLHSCRWVGRCMDLFAPVGEPIYAMAAGVAQVHPYAAHSYGNYVTITHQDGTVSLYAHLSQVNVIPGPVSAGTALGTVGCSGTSGEPNGCANSPSHLHLEWSGLRWNQGEYGELPPYFPSWRGTPRRCYQGC